MIYDNDYISSFQIILLERKLVLIYVLYSSVSVQKYLPKLALPFTSLTVASPFLNLGYTTETCLDLSDAFL